MQPKSDSLIDAKGRIKTGGPLHRLQKVAESSPGGPSPTHRVRPYAGDVLDVCEVIIEAGRVANNFTPKTAVAKLHEEAAKLIEANLDKTGIETPIQKSALEALIADAVAASQALMAAAA